MSKSKNHAFSIELNHKGNVKTLALANTEGNPIIMEGFLGELVGVCLVESVMLEIQGSEGVFRLDLEAEDISRFQQAIAKEGKNQ